MSADELLDIDGEKRPVIVFARSLEFCVINDHVSNPFFHVNQCIPNICPSCKKEKGVLKVRGNCRLVGLVPPHHVCLDCHPQDHTCQQCNYQGTLPNMYAYHDYHGFYSPHESIESIREEQKKD